jgi:hypothetical protein
LWDNYSCFTPRNHKQTSVPLTRITWKHLSYYLLSHFKCFQFSLPLHYYLFLSVSLAFVVRIEHSRKLWEFYIVITLTKVAHLSKSHYWICLMCQSYLTQLFIELIFRVEMLWHVQIWCGKNSTLLKLTLH